ncbi:OLC1v1015705C1 [Oldenlandia corymbosa var. corymbosa]|uniref:OLC1v1015705C1 n=1 Tax=Oldenlandia corymbosa var. corymbosa TaxID=529605 RepID=A0AAV1E6W2_OLDCO|nr:OLC1v1015705C1 [Oldenlandia corymbosa var. corymbosa]
MATPTELMGIQMRQSLSDGRSSGKRQDETELAGRDLNAKRQLQWSEMMERDEKQGVWAKNDTSKFKAPSGKLQFIPPKEVAGQNIAQMQMEDVKSEAEYWESSIAYFVLGAHPPIGIMERYFQKLWGNLGIDKVILLPSGLFIVRFTTLNARDSMLNVNFYHFGSKPLIVKPWDVEKGINYNDVDYVPIWIRLYGLEVKFWNLNSLSRLVVYEWLPTRCAHCTEYGHLTDKCRLKLRKVEDKPKQPLSAWKKVEKDEGRSNAEKIIVTDDNQRKPTVRRKDQSSCEGSLVKSIGQFANSLYEEGNLEKNKGDQSCEDETMKGLMFTWCNQRLGTERIYAKLDRALVNSEWIDQYVESIATVLMEGVSDHSPIEVQFKAEMQRRRSAFRFFNTSCLSTEFLSTVEKSWAASVEGTSMYQLCQKLKRLKYPLKKLNRLQFADIVEKANRGQVQLEVMQQKLSFDPGDVDLQIEERKLYHLDAKIWNKAALPKEVWQIASQKDALWIKWIHGVYIKSSSFWEVEAKCDASWQWKKLLKIRDQGKLGFAGSSWLALNNGKYIVKSGYTWLTGNEGRSMPKFQDGLFVKSSKGCSFCPPSKNHSEWLNSKSPVISHGGYKDRSSSMTCTGSSSENPIQLKEKAAMVPFYTQPRVELQEQQLELSIKKHKATGNQFPRVNQGYSRTSELSKQSPKSSKSINPELEDADVESPELEALELLVDDGIDLNDLTIEEGSMHVLSVDCVKQTILVARKVQGRIVKILIDTGSTDSFVDMLLVKEMRLPFVQSHTFTIIVGDGNKISGNLISPNLHWNIEEYKFSFDLKIMKLGGYDMIIAVDWMRHFNPITFDYDEMHERLSKYGRQHILQGTGTMASMSLIREENCPGVKQERRCRMFAVQLQETESVETMAGTN